MEVALPGTGLEARKIGAKKYFTGVPCLKGHISERYAHNGQCFGCAQEASKTNHARRLKQGAMRAFYEKRRIDEPEKIMYYSAKSRARSTGVPFSVTFEDIKAVFPVDGLCPVLGIKLENNFDGKSKNHHASSPSLDKIVPELGYVVGNIAVISMHANRLKGDETDPAMFRKLADWIERNTKCCTQQKNC